MTNSADPAELLSSTAKLLAPSYPVAPTPGRISFAYGLCAPESFRPGQLALSAAKVLQEHPTRALQYGPAQGSRSLIEQLSSFLRQRGLPADESRLILTTGSMQALELVGQLLLDPGDVTLVEGPTFMGALEIFRKLRARVVCVPMDDQGIVPDQLEDAIRGILAQRLRPKMLYTIPTFQNPSGITASLSRRRRILEIAEAYGIPVVEDDAYREIWFYEPPPPPYLSQEAGITIYLGTFSKLLAPGLRSGWILAPPALVPRILALKRDAGSSPFVAEVIATFMKEFHFNAHLSELRRIYRERAERAQRAAQRYLGNVAQWKPPMGGFFLWLETPGVTDAQLVEAMASHGVEAIPGSQCFPDARRTSCLRIAFSSIPTDQIDEGIRRIAMALETIMQ